jgi:uncharacterized membrane protein YdfJ with MMPL/SSD domain
MERLFASLATFVLGRRRLILLVWVGLAIVSLPLVAQQSKTLTNGGYVVPGSESAAVEKAFAQFPQVPRYDLVVVLQTHGPDPAAIGRAARRIGATVASADGVRVTQSARRRAVRLARDSSTVILPIDVTGGYNDANDAAVELEPALNADAGGVQQYFVGQSAYWAALSHQTQEDLKQAEVFGLPISLLILVCVFGSLTAALLPVALGLIAILMTGAVIALLSQVSDVSVYVTNAVSMIGIGVAIDYSLFILIRYRQHRLAGEDESTALASAIRTSGFAVAVSALTVIVAFLGLFLVDSTVLRSLAAGAIVVVAIALLGALTLTPVLTKELGLRGRRFKRALAGTGSAGPAASVDPSATASPLWRGWTRRVMRRPVLSVTLSAGILLLLAAPALDLNADERALVMLPQDSRIRTGLDLVEPLVGEGATGPIRVLAEFRSGKASDPGNAAAIRDFRSSLLSNPEIASIQPAAVSQDGRSTLLTAIPALQPDSPEASELVASLRRSTKESALGHRAATAIGGTTAQTRDFEQLIAGSLWKVFLFVVFATFILLAVLLRSVLLPVKAVVVTSLTVAASYGVLVAIFQWGVFGSSLGYICAMNLPLILAVTFGLTMDYQVFLLLRIRERYVVTKDNERAVAEGLASSAGVITSAAAIMVAIFLSFAFTGIPGIRQIGIGLAVAVTLDATLVRLVLVPAAMKLFGTWNWWFPKPLSARLPTMPSEFSLGSGAATSSR